MQCTVYTAALHCSQWAKVSFLHGLGKNGTSTVCPAFIPLLFDICHFLSLLLAVSGLHVGSSTDALFKFKLLILLLLHFDSGRSLERDRYQIAQSTWWQLSFFVQHIWLPKSQLRRLQPSQRLWWYFLLWLCSRTARVLCCEHPYQQVPVCCCRPPRRLKKNSKENVWFLGNRWCQVWSLRQKPGMYSTWTCCPHFLDLSLSDAGNQLCCAVFFCKIWARGYIIM